MSILIIYIITSILSLAFLGLCVTELKYLVPLCAINASIITLIAKGLHLCF